MLPRHHRIAVLYGRDRTDFVGAAQIFLRSFRNTPVEDFALTNQVGHHTCHFFRRNLRVDTVLVIEVDAVGMQAVERFLDRAADGRRT